MVVVMVLVVIILMLVVLRLVAVVLVIGSSGINGDNDTWWLHSAAHKGLTCFL